MKNDWIWMPHAGHLCVASHCRFHLNTYVNGYIVSTVGEYVPDETLRDIVAESKGIKLKGKGDEREYDFLKRCGFEEIGLGRKYETMVFKAVESGEKCCPYVAISGELETKGYNKPEDATKGHYELCEKYNWSRKK